jgi:hypothetical protein
VPLCGTPHKGTLLPVSFPGSGHSLWIYERPLSRSLDWFPRAETNAYLPAEVMSIRIDLTGIFLYIHYAA